MVFLRATSIKRKLTLLVMLTTTVALLAAAVQFIVNDVRDYHRRVVADLAILAHIIGENCTSALDFDDPKAGPAAIAFTPDGKTALVTRDGDHRISILSVDGTNVSDTKRVMTGGHRPYAVHVSPKGDIAVIGNQGANAGDIMPVNVVDLKGKAPRIVNTEDVGQ